jgi:hypothetical protein
MLALVDLLLPFRFRFYYNSKQILFPWTDRYPLQTVAKGNEIHNLKKFFIELKIMMMTLLQGRSIAVGQKNHIEQAILTIPLLCNSSFPFV